MNLSKALKNKNYKLIADELYKIDELKVFYTDRQTLVFCNKVLKSFEKEPDMLTEETTDSQICWIMAVKLINILEGIFR